MGGDVRFKCDATNIGGRSVVDVPQADSVVRNDGTQDKTAQQLSIVNTSGNIDEHTYESTTMFVKVNNTLRLGKRYG